MARKKQRSPYEGRLNELERIVINAIEVEKSED